MERKLSIPKISVIFVLFLIIWGVRVLFIPDLPEAEFSRWAQAAVDGGLKAIIWLGFGFFFLHRYKQELPVNPKKMFTQSLNARLLLSMGGLICFYQVLGMFVRHRGFHINPDFHPSDIITMFLVVGIAEELVFRGFFMNALSKHVGEENANMLSALFFVVIHFPKYINDGTFFSVQIIFNCAFLFCIGLFFGYAFRRTHSIWTPAILHSLWDLLAVLIGM